MNKDYSVLIEDLEKEEHNLIIGFKNLLNSSLKQITNPELRQHILYLVQRTTNLDTLFSALKSIRAKDPKKRFVFVNGFINAFKNNSDLLNGLEAIGRKELVENIEGSTPNLVRKSIVYNDDELEGLGFVEEHIQTIDGLGKLRLKRAFKKVAKAAKKATKSVAKGTFKVVKTVAKGIKKGFIALKKGLKKAWRIVARYNPLSIITRASILTFIKLNVFNVGYKCGIGFLTEEEAKKIKISKETWLKCVKLKKSLLKVFVNVLMGREKNIKKQCFKALKHKLKKSKINTTINLGDIGYLGMEPGTITAISAAATALATVILEAKGTKVNAQNDDGQAIDMDAVEPEVQQTAMSQEEIKTNYQPEDMVEVNRLENQDAPDPQYNQEYQTQVINYAKSHSSDADDEIVDESVLDREQQGNLNMDAEDVGGFLNGLETLNKGALNGWFSKKDKSQKNTTTATTTKKPFLKRIFGKKDSTNTTSKKTAKTTKTATTTTRKKPFLKRIFGKKDSTNMTSKKTAKTTKTATNTGTRRTTTNNNTVKSTQKSTNQNQNKTSFIDKILNTTTKIIQTKNNIQNQVKQVKGDTQKIQSQVKQVTNYIKPKKTSNNTQQDNSNNDDNTENVIKETSTNPTNSKNALLIGGAALGLGVLFLALNKKK